MSDKLLDVKQVIELLAIGESTWWSGVASGRFPPAIKLGARLTRWRMSDIQKIIEGGQNAHK